jgi:hypothetical protein
MIDREKVIHLSTEIEQTRQELADYRRLLEEREGDLDVLLAQLDELLGNSGEANGSIHILGENSGPRMRRRRVTGGDSEISNPDADDEDEITDVGEPLDSTLSDKVCELLSQYPGLVFDADKVAEFIQDAKLVSIRSTLIRLRKLGKIQKVSRGRYRTVPERAASVGGLTVEE